MREIKDIVVKETVGLYQLSEGSQIVGRDQLPSNQVVFIGKEEQFFDEAIVGLYFETVFFENTTEAIDWLNDRLEQNDRLPVAILCQVDILNGSNSFIERIRQRVQLKLIPLIVISEDFKKEYRLKAFEIGADDLFERKGSINDLVYRIAFLRKLKEHKLQSLVDNKSTDSNEFFYAARPGLLKRSFDIAFAGLCILILSPLLLLIALAIKIESRGPIIYKSKRAGTAYRIFDFYKFRSMRVGAEDELNKLNELNQYDGEDKEGHLFFKIKNDPRVTRVGSLLRNTSLDELPQLFNVIIGDMSIVGNRPLPLYEAEKLTMDQRAHRFLAPAGITGLWQVEKRGREKMSVEERISLDIEYAQNHSFMYDLVLLFKTIPALIQKEDV